MTWNSQIGFMKMVVKIDGEGARRLSMARMVEAVGMNPKRVIRLVFREAPKARHDPRFMKFGR
jgi:hypothetical protein